MTQALTLPSNLSASSLDAYLASVASVPILSAEQEHELATRLQQDNDLEAARTLVMSHMRYVVHIARSYMGYGLALPDLIQEGNIGLMKAVKRFDPDMGVRLVSYAVHWIKAEIHEYIIRNWRIVKVATTKAQRKLFFNLRKMKKNLSWLSDDEAHAVAKDLGVDKSAVYEMEKRLSSHDMAFDGHQDDDDSEHHVPVTPALYLSHQHNDPAELIERQNQDDHVELSLHQALATLDPRSREILSDRWLTEKKSTLHELAERYQVSAERIRQIEKNALSKVRTALPESLAI